MDHRPSKLAVNTSETSNRAWQLDMQVVCYSYNRIMS